MFRLNCGDKREDGEAGERRCKGAGERGCHGVSVVGAGFTDNSLLQTDNLTKPALTQRSDFLIPLPCCPILYQICLIKRIQEFSGG
ncbi:hypothetical protein [Coleofasciculus sp. E2-BRE-01]|uniref:hypothetical protein n=1 Tax=Coleofasciculus sp. E2-BRE-01 TaxID=3069524 RepID=UPI0033034658